MNKCETCGKESIVHNETFTMVAWCNNKACPDAFKNIKYWEKKIE